jgi:hypothetical protein
MASLGSKRSSKNGVARIEKPNPVLVCKMDAIKIIRMKRKISMHKTCFLPYFNTAWKQSGTL